jgi:hypothetical protein
MLLYASWYNKWIDQQLEDAMDVVVQGHTSLKKISKFWNIPLTLLLHHFNGRTRIRKMGLQGVLMKPKDEAIVTWILNTRKVALSIILQLELKVVEVTRTKPTPFLNGVPGIDWWYVVQMKTSKN